MAILRASEIREMSAEELEDKLAQLQKDLMKVRGILASGGIPENVGRIRETKRTIARIQTLKNVKTTTETKDKKK